MSNRSGIEKIILADHDYSGDIKQLKNVHPTNKRLLLESLVMMNSASFQVSEKGIPDYYGDPGDCALLKYAFKLD
jgi:hypothetical protein